MSFRKKQQQQQKPDSVMNGKSKSFSIFSKLFLRNNLQLNGDKLNSKSPLLIVNNANSIDKLENDDIKFLKDLELDLIYLSRLLQQKIENLNRINILLQLRHCSQLIEQRLKESRSWLDGLDEDSCSSIEDIYETFQNYYVNFKGWVDGLTNDMTDGDRNIGQQLFLRMEFEARDFIGRAFERQSFNMVSSFKRGSLDNRSFHSVDTKSRFTDDDRLLIDRMRQLESDVEVAPSKPSLPQVSPTNIDQYLQKIEELARAQLLITRQKSINDTNSTYQYSYIDCANNNLVKIVDNCIMAASIISNEIPSVDADELGSNFNSTPDLDRCDFDLCAFQKKHSSTPIAPIMIDDNCEIEDENQLTPRKRIDANQSIVNSHPINGQYLYNVGRQSYSKLPLRSRDIPLPPLPSDNRRNSLPRQLSKGLNIFHSEQKNNNFNLNQSKTTQSRIVSTPITNFTDASSPLRSPGFISSCVNQISHKNIHQNDDNYNHISPNNQIITPNKKSQSLTPPDSLSSSPSPLSSSSSNFNNNRYLLMAKQIPSVVADPNQLLNINDMRDDIEIMATNSANSNFLQTHSKRSSGCSTKTTVSMPTNIPSTRNDMNNNNNNIDEVCKSICSNNSEQQITSTDPNDVQCDSEVKSDTEEYFEYFEIDGRKYRRKMKKRIVIEKIKIKKTILAPMKLDGSGPDLKGLENVDDDEIDDDEMNISKEFEKESQQLKLKDKEHDEEDATKDTPENVPNSKKIKYRTSVGNRRNNKLRISRFILFPDDSSPYNMIESMSNMALNDKCETLVPSSTAMSLNETKPQPILANYMYKFGQTNVEKDPMLLSKEKFTANQRYSHYLESPSVGHQQSTWMQTAESNMPHEKSKSICFLRKYRQQNEEGTTVHGAVRVTSSRTVRMKPLPNDGNENMKEHTKIPTRAIMDNYEDNGDDDSDLENSENIGDEDKSIESQSKSESQIDDLEDEKSLISDSLESEEEEIEQHANKVRDEEEDEEGPSLSVSSSDTEQLTPIVSNKDNPFDNIANDDDSTPLPQNLIMPISFHNNNPRTSSIDSSFSSLRQSSFFSETRDQFSFILKESNPYSYMIFDYEAKIGECDIAGAPVDALIVYACDVTDYLFLGAFLETYRTFIEPEDLINRLIIRYKYYRNRLISQQNILNPEINDENNRDSLLDPPTGVRIRNKRTSFDDSDKKSVHALALLLPVIGKLKRDLTETVLQQVQVFQQYLTEIHETSWVCAITQAISTNRNHLQNDNELIEKINIMSGNTKFSYSRRSLGIPNSEAPTGGRDWRNLMNFNSKELAEQMTILAWTRYRDVELNEILNRTDIDRCHLPGVTEYARHFDNIELWTEFMILDTDKHTVSERDKVCNKILHIMKHLRRLNNFNTLAAILLAILDLEDKKLFSKKISAKVREWSQYLLPPRFAGYKADLRDAGAPCIPFLGLFYQDLTFLNIANPSHLDLQQLITRLEAINASKPPDKNNINNERCSSSILCNLHSLASVSAEQCGPIVNFWRSFKQYVFLKNCNKDQDQIRYSIQPNETILRFINNFLNHPDKIEINQLMKQVH